MPVNLAIHASQFPDRVDSDLRDSLRTRKVNHKFHYDSLKQTQKWLALHQAYSPSRTDPNCATIYDLGFAGAVKRIQPARIHLIGLGCGGGQKDARLLKSLQAGGKEASYTPVDVSTAMVLVAHQAALEVLPTRDPEPATGHSAGLVCDLLGADDLPEWFNEQTPTGAVRIITFFGMIPNFEPPVIMPKLARLVRPGDHLLFSANLAPGNDYAAGVRHILPLYDNELTSEWLLTFLLDLGVERNDGELVWSVEADSSAGDLLRVVARFHFQRVRIVRVAEEQFEFRPGETIRLFFSYRYTPDRVRALLAKHGLRVEEQWVTDSEEEGVFLCRREAGPA